MSHIERINEILQIKDSYKAPDRILEILQDRKKREKIFHQFLELFKYRMDYDWFHEYFQEEHADRKNKKQDFTPMSVANLLTELVGESNSYHEATAGTGGITISKWQADRLKSNPFDYRPSDYIYVCEELSDRAIPFLLFNLAIRGMNAVVIHCDVLTRESYGVFFVQNDDNHPEGFSSINVMPYSESVQKYYKINFIEERYPVWVESPEQKVSCDA